MKLEKAIEIVENIKASVPPYLPNAGEALDTVIKAAMVDAEPVKHGYWEVCGIFDDFVRCSKCHEHKMPMSMTADYDFSYCPHCGAKMDLEETE